jgi:hypothetical protein
VEEREIKIEMEKALPPPTHASLGDANTMHKAEDIVSAMVKLAYLEMGSGCHHPPRFI